VTGKWIAAKRLWQRQEVRFLVVGGGNTVSGYLLSVLIYFLLNVMLPLLVIIAIQTVVNVTISFLTQKLLVFRTRGNYLAEYLRFYVVSAVPIVMNFVLLPVAIDWLGMNPYLAMALLMILMVVILYFGHKYISFRKRAAAPPGS
jgi:putative flippase GtrA